MNAKNAVMLSDEDLRYAEELVEDGRFPSVSDVVKAALRGCGCLSRLQTIRWPEWRTKLGGARNCPRISAFLGMAKPWQKD